MQKKKNKKRNKLILSKKKDLDIHLSEKINDSKTDNITFRRLHVIIVKWINEK